jgi:hypothetical protein
MMCCMIALFHFTAPCSDSHSYFCSTSISCSVSCLHTAKDWVAGFSNTTSNLQCVSSGTVDISYIAGTFRDFLQFANRAVLCTVVFFNSLHCHLLY